MRSKQVILNYEKDVPEYTDLMVLKSAAGYYIGTLYNNPEGFQEPGTRDSGYFPTREAAEYAFNNEDYIERLYP